METRVQIVAILVSAALLLGLFELVRQRRLLERYALLWMFSAFTLLLLATWTGLLETFAEAVGIKYAPSALFVVAFGFILLLLLHFSVAVSRMADQNKVLAQRLALLEERQRQGEARAGPDADEPAGAAPREPALRD
jgi:hypothetical protein